VLRSIASRWWGGRIVGYLAVALGSFLTGVVPLLQSVLLLVALFVLHIALMRRALCWLSPGRRVAARFTIKLWGAGLACLNLLLNVAVAPLIGLSAGILALSGFTATVLYVEGGLLLIRQRMRWELEGRRLSMWEWGLPASLIGGLALVTFAGIGSGLGLLYVLADAEIPKISALAAWLLEG
jgi:hypothetical protein